MGRLGLTDKVGEVDEEKTNGEQGRNFPCEINDILALGDHVNVTQMVQRRSIQQRQQSQDQRDDSNHPRKLVTKVQQHDCNTALEDAEPDPMQVKTLVRELGHTTGTLDLEDWVGLTPGSDTCRKVLALLLRLRLIVIPFRSLLVSATVIVIDFVQPRI